MKELFFNNDKAYIILRRIPLHVVTNKKGEIVSQAFNGWKDHLGADHVLKTATHFLYCETIQDAEWEEEKTEEIKTIEPKDNEL